MARISKVNPQTNELISQENGLLIEFNERDHLKVIKKYLRNMGVFQKEMGESFKLQYF